MRKETIGPCQLYLGDCLDILPEIGGCHAVVADPPYFLSLANDCRDRVNPWANLCNGSTFIAAWMREAAAHMDRGAIWSFMNWQSMPAFVKAGFDGGFPMRSLLVWDKNTMGTGMIGLRPSYELAAFFPVGGFCIERRDQRDIWTIPPVKTSGHPAEKPVALLRRLLDISTAAGETVLDPFMGSGSTGMAAIQSGREFIGIEMDPHWFDAACRRLETALAENSLLNLARGGENKE